MHLIDQRILGILVVALLGILIAIKRISTGSILERPGGDLLLWFVNVFNLFFLLIVNPLAAILLISRQMDSVDPTFWAMGEGWFRSMLEIGGLLIYLTGFLLMGWALISLGVNYQLGGAEPRASDRMVIKGPYTIIRHPMYTAALCIALGLACFTQSLACLAVFAIYLVLMILLIPKEEEVLIRTYGEAYRDYRQKVKRLIPFLY